MKAMIKSQKFTFFLFLKITSVYLFRAALCKLMFVLHKDVLFHWRDKACTGIEKTSLSKPSTNITQCKNFYPSSCLAYLYYQHSGGTIDLVSQVQGFKPNQVESGRGRKKEIVYSEKICCMKLYRSKQLSNPHFN